MVKTNKLDNESNDQYIFRVCQMKDQLGYTWKQIADVINNELGNSFDESCYRKKVQHFNTMMKANEATLFDNEEIQAQRRELEKERIKLKSEKLEYNKWLRENARDELIVEKIVDAVKQLDPITPPSYIAAEQNTRSYYLAFGDEHFGTEFQIVGLNGEILNEYSPEIFEQRMWDLLRQIVGIIYRENIGVLNVMCLGDAVDGILRVSQLMKLRYGVVESSVKYANFMAYWFNELTKYVRVNCQMTFGNHSELRMLGQPKGTFKEDNTGLFIKEILSERLRENKNFNMINNPTGLMFFDENGFNVLGIHGDVKNMERSIKDFSTVYRTRIDYLIGGHMHHLKTESVGVRQDVLSVPSIIGIDDFAMSINKSSDPGALLFVLEKGKGKVMEYDIKL